MNLVAVLQRLYDSEINVTITMLWDGGFDFALISSMDLSESNRPISYGMRIASTGLVGETPGESPWVNVATAGELAEAIHQAALLKYPQSTYARSFRIM